MLDSPQALIMNAPPRISAPAGGLAATPLWVVAGLAMGPAIAQGFGRFAYALLLPEMRADLAWSYADAGAVSTSNAVGYLAGALIAAAVAARFGAKRAFAASLFISALAIAGSAAAVDYWPQMALRALAGLGGGVAFVVGGSLASLAGAGGGARARAPIAIGIYVSGAGFGIALSALLVPVALAEAGWQGGWLALGLLSALAWGVALPALRRAPEPPRAVAGTAPRRISVRPMLFELIAYGLLGAGYIAYATFAVAYLKAELGFAAIEVSAFWITLGLSAIASAFVWGPALGRLRGGFGLVATSAVMTAAVVLLLADASRPAAYVSAALFGASGFASITAVTMLARRVYPPEAWTAAIGALTVSFGVGQIIGPVLSGAVSDGPHGLRAGLVLSVWILAAGIATALFQRERRA